MLSNIWAHPKTSAAGVLVAIITAAGVLSAQGVTLGHAGTGTIVSLAGALATAFLGLLSRDPGTKPNLLLAVVMVGGLVMAQAVHAQAPDQQLQNIYAGGVSYSVNASPAVAGTALYAHVLNDSGTYAFTAIDAVPASVKPFTVTSNVGAGVAQKVFTVGKYPVFMPTAAGVSWTGSHTGWQWNGGALIAIPIKGGYYVMPSVRFLKSSVSGGGYQPIIGVLFGWGK